MCSCQLPLTQMGISGVEGPLRIGIGSRERPWPAGRRRQAVRDVKPRRLQIFDNVGGAALGIVVSGLAMTPAAMLLAMTCCRH
jgi:hypothetical protein